MSREEFLRHLREALIHLHDATHLRQSPLAALFDVANRFDTSLALRKTLVEAIESLRAEEGDPCPAHAWQAHDSLFCCYVQHLSQRVVADQLAMSPRQLRRQQRAALEVLADRLWEQFDLCARLAQDRPPQAASAPAAVAPAATNDELAWLKDAPLERPTDLRETLLSVTDMTHTLAAQHGARLQLEVPRTLPGLTVHPVALSEILLSLLSVAISRAAGSRVWVSARPLSWDVEVEVRGEGYGSSEEAETDDAAILTIAHQLVELCSGRLTVGDDEHTFSATLTLPAVERLPVLVIDDNADALQLFQRYTSGTRYRFIGSGDPQEALLLAERVSPQVIVLDVMMPQVDGWKVLGRLRQHPVTGHIPIVVCTILAQKALAVSLGASAFVRKPVSRAAFLAALDRHCSPKDTERR